MIPAQLAQTQRLHAPRQPHRQYPSEAEMALLQTRCYQAAAKDAQRNLRNERKRSNRVKDARLGLVKEKENMRMAAEHQGKEEAVLRTKLAGVEARLEIQLRENKTLSARISRLPLQKKLAVGKAVKAAMRNGKFKIRTPSGRISTPARRIVRQLVLHNKVSTSMTGGVLSILTNAEPGKWISPRSARRIVGEVGVGNKLRIVGKVRKSKGERNPWTSAKRPS